MYDLPGMQSVEKVVVNGDVVTGKAEPLLIHAEKPKGEPKASA
jgi:ATP-dependent Clp protease ATP-binding subunit ClpX